jgi:hypothetical protein
MIAMLAAMLVALMAGQPALAADVPPPPGSWAELTPPFFNQDQPKCLDVPRGSDSPGLVIEVFHCHGYASNGHPQRWLFIADGNVFGSNEQLFLIKNIASDLCLTVNGTGISGREVTQTRCTPGSSLQGWYQELTPLYGPYFALRSFHNRANCLATSNGSGADGTTVTASQCTVGNPLDQNTKRQVWSFG